MTSRTISILALLAASTGCPLTPHRAPPPPPPVTQHLERIEDLGATGVAYPHDHIPTRLSAFAKLGATMDQRTQAALRSLPGQIIDPGWPGLRQRADANGDGTLDYCRIVGNAGSERVSCQLGAGDALSDEPYGFNSPTGIALGVESLPRGFIDLNGDHRADFCRYVYSAANPIRVRTQQLVCNLAEATGFAAVATPDTRTTLFSAPDGSTIGYREDATTGTVVAFARDQQGIARRLTGTGQFAPGVSMSTFGIYVGDSKQPLVWSYATMTDGGYVDVYLSGPFDGYEFSGILRAFPPYNEVGGANFDSWRCAHPRRDCDVTTVSATYYPAEDRLAWGRPPPDPATFLATEAADLQFFGGVFDHWREQTDARFHTGVDWFDAKHWFEHDGAEWDRLDSALTADAKTEIQLVTWLGRIAKVAFAGFGAGIGGVPGALIGGLLGLGVNGLEDKVINLVTEYDARWCETHQGAPGCDWARALTDSP